MKQMLIIGFINNNFYKIYKDIYKFYRYEEEFKFN